MTINERRNDELIDGSDNMRTTAQNSTVRNNTARNSAGRNSAGRNNFDGRVIQPGSTIGVLGGGQLGRMLALAGTAMGYRFVTLDPTEDSPCGQVASEQIVAAYDDAEAARQLAARCDVITYEFENVDADVAAMLEQESYVPQGSQLLAMTQHRLREKQALEAAGVKVAPYFPIANETQLKAAVAELGLPCVLKTTTGGYDGKGQVVIRREEEVATAFARLTGGRVSGSDEYRRDEGGHDKSRINGSQLVGQDRSWSEREESRSNESRLVEQSRSWSERDNNERAVHGRGEGSENEGRHYESQRDKLERDQHLAPLVCEQFVPFVKELSVIAARSPNGEVRAFPVAENVHVDNILHVSIVPARIEASIAAQAEQLAIRIAQSLQVVGLIAVEMFLTETGELFVNELAPRPHNSGHYTMEACRTSQFEQHIRAICNLPLTSTELMTPVVMVNILGEHVESIIKNIASKQAQYANLTFKTHLYGKKEAKIGRKMGHINILTSDVDLALEWVQRSGIW